MHAERSSEGKRRVGDRGTAGRHGHRSSEGRGEGEDGGRAEAERAVMGSSRGRWAR